MRYCKTLEVEIKQIDLIEYRTNYHVHREYDFLNESITSSGFTTYYTEMHAPYKRNLFSDFYEK